LKLSISERVVRDANAAPEAGVEHRLLVTHEFDAHRRMS